jgi:GntR family transcriptional regulator of arabinose operon
MTVVKAMQQLRQEGLIVRRAKSGSFAAPSTPNKAPVYGLLIPDLGQTEIFEPICKGMARSSNAGGHSLSWGHSRMCSADKGEDAEDLCNQYIEQQITGMLFAPLEFDPKRDQINHRILKALRRASIPVLLLDRCVLPYPERSEYDVVGLDNRRAGFVMAEHLIKQQAQNIGFLAEVGSAETVDKRIVGFRDALYLHWPSVRRTVVIQNDGPGSAVIMSAIKKHKLDAIQCANDHTAVKLMRTLINLGVRIPEDVRIAGVDDVKYAYLLPVPLTTFHQPCIDIGETAVAAMRERTNNPQLPGRSIMLNRHLVVRQSCGAANAG